MSDQDLGRRQFLGGAARAAARDAAAPSAPPLKDVAGKVAFITGTSSGIGLGQAQVFKVRRA